jgi:hypothetical protein
VAAGKNIPVSEIRSTLPNTKNMAEFRVKSFFFSSLPSKEQGKQKHDTLLRTGCFITRTSNTEKTICGDKLHSKS